MERIPTIKQYSLQGDRLATWHSPKTIMRAGFNYRRILNCCEHRTRTSQGFIWRYGNEPPSYLEAAKFKTRKTSRPVIGYNRKTGYKKTYESIGMAARMIGGKQPGISRCLAGKRLTYYGYYWVYADNEYQQRG